MPRSSKKKTYKLIFLCVVCLATYSKSAVAHWTLNVVICVWETESSSAHTNECIYRFAKESLCVFMLYKWERLKKFSTNLHSTTEHRMNNIFFLHLKQTTTHRESEREDERARTRASKLSATTESKSESLHGRERERERHSKENKWVTEDWRLRATRKGGKKISWTKGKFYELSALYTNTTPSTVDHFHNPIEKWGASNEQMYAFSIPTHTNIYQRKFGYISVECMAFQFACVLVNVYWTVLLAHMYAFVYMYTAF